MGCMKVRCDRQRGGLAYHRRRGGLGSRPHVEVVDVEEDLAARHHQLQLALDVRHLVLPRAPRVREEQMVPSAFVHDQLRLLAGIPQSKHIRIAPAGGSLAHGVTLVSVGMMVTS